jgi:SAM-dependent methyltransferase
MKNILHKNKYFIKKAIRYALSPFIIKDYIVYKDLDKSNRFTVSKSDFFPCIKDKTITTGFDRHYVYHTAWAVRVVKEIDPSFHIDISSSLYFCGLLSAFIPVKFYDYRPANLSLSGLETLKGDLHSLPFQDNSVESISCMHTIEHVGLGRYGDPIDPDGDLKAIKELKRVVKPGGSLLIVVPIGKPKIEFNAHRIYSYSQIISCFTEDKDFTLEEFSFIPEKEGPMVRNADPKLSEDEHYACGCFWFKKNML